MPLAGGYDTSASAQQPSTSSTSSTPSTNIWSDIIDLFAIVGGVIAAPFTGGTSLLVSAYGLTDLIKTNIEASTAATTATQNSNQLTGDQPKVPPVGGTADLTGPDDASGNTQTNTPTVASEEDIVKEKMVSQQEQEAAYENQALQQILDLKTQEMATEGTMIATAAARGVKINSGTAARQLSIQQQKGSNVIGNAEQQVGIGIAGQKQDRLITENTGLLNMSNSQLGITQTYQTDMSNMWLNSLSGLMDTATASLKLWNPSTTGYNNSASVTTGGPQGDESGIDYYGY